MRLLVVTQYFWPENFRITELLEGLVARGHEVTVLTGIPNYPTGRFFEGYGLKGPWRQQHKGIQIVRCPLVPRFRGRGWQLAANYLSFAFLASLLGPLLCRGKYDLILSYAPSPVTVAFPAIVMKYWKRAPLFFWVQDLWPESLEATGAVRSRKVLGLAGRMVRFIYSRCDRILIQSEAFFERVKALGAEPSRILYFPNSAEKLYRPLEPQKEGHQLPHGFRVMFAGNIGAAQDFGTILDAAERLKDKPGIQWLVLGDGRERSWVEAEVARRGLRKSFHLLGRHPMEAMPGFFSEADAMLVTLKKEPIFALTVPAKIQSYMACAKPVIAALDGEGARVVREASAGVTCPAEDPEGLAQAVLALSQLPEAERKAMGNKGFHYFQNHFESSRLLDQLEAWADSATGIRKRPAGSNPGIAPGNAMEKADHVS